tara:strand:+ start:139 stop:927 length:789 start_codon:yes stop_codon:yes gene_type:complete
MAISRAQIPEQVDLFDEGGGVGSTPSALSPEDILDLYGALQQSPVTSEDIKQQAQLLTGLFPQQKKQNFFDLASAVGEGLVAGAASPGGFGVGFSAGLQTFNERAKKIQMEKDAMQQQLAMLAYEQVEARRKEQAEKSKDILEMQFKAALDGQGVDFGSSTLGKALAFIVQAQKNPDLKNTPEYKVAVALAGQDKNQIIQTETGAISVTLPGLKIDEIFADKNITPPPSTVIEDGKTYTFTGKYQGDQPIYLGPDGQEGVIK